jgi:cation diffusion facilitator CzcD-associated flavoprotein CzcO
MRKYTIVGAGPGGILAIAYLLDHGVKASEIIWIDPHFNGGRLNERYRTVESNDIVQEWYQVLARFNCLQKYQSRLLKYDPEVNEHLAVIADILLEATRSFLRTRIKAIRDTVTKLERDRDIWKIYFKNHRRIRSNNVILSTGSHPKRGASQYLTPDGQVLAKEVIDLDIALNQDLLKTLVKPTDCVVVVGSGQSAVLLLKYLSELGCKSITNVYRLTLEQTVKTLRGGTKRWCEEHMHNVLEVERIHEDDIDKVKCAKLIYATGFERNRLPECNLRLDLDHPDGILAPNLFGFGIAFPDRAVLGDGLVMKRVGLTSFSKTLERRMPIWFQQC